jgi:hypothetical protein
MTAMLALKACSAAVSSVNSEVDQCLLNVYHHRGTEEDEKERHFE